MMEKEKEKEFLHHSFHQHPLSPIEIDRSKKYCCGCGKNFPIGERAYRCSTQCGNDMLLHEECAEMPRKIKHPTHPQHILIQKSSRYAEECAVCERSMYSAWWCYHSYGYYCAVGCRFGIHWGCAPIRGVIHAAADDEEEEGKMQSIKHPCHPEHELKLLKRNRRSSSFKCDACGTLIGKGNSYICSSCQYWIHESCASLPTTMELREDLHEHPLSLTFHLPQQYLKFDHKCDICSKDLLLKYWAYHCQFCRYAVHIKCAMDASPPAASINNDDEGIFQFPISDVSEELIRTSIMRETGIIPHDKYKFHNHHHQLSLISLEESDDDDEEDHKPELELICDGCVTPIHQKKKQNSSSSSSSSPNSHKYYSCGECKYFLHLACFHLPDELPSHSLHQDCNQKLILQSPPKLSFEWTRCDICRLPMNGLFYGCSNCNFKADIKCTSLPNTIKHAGHDPQHHHYLKFVVESIDGIYGHCGACGDVMVPSIEKFYRCESCEFSLHCKCALLPSANKHKWDKHALSMCIMQLRHVCILMLSKSHRCCSGHRLTRIQIDVRLHQYCSKE